MKSDAEAKNSYRFNLAYMFTSPTKPKYPYRSTKHRELFHTAITAADFFPEPVLITIIARHK
jgi:hypothetical protein